METDIRSACRHEVAHHGRIGVVACEACRSVEWFSEGRPVDHAPAMAALFGNYELVGVLPALGAPADTVLAYRPGVGKRRALHLLPLGAWLEASPGLWLASDGNLLLLATADRLLVSNLTRGA